MQTVILADDSGWLHHPLPNCILKCLSKTCGAPVTGGTLDNSIRNSLNRISSFLGIFVIRFEWPWSWPVRAT